MIDPHPKQMGRVRVRTVKQGIRKTSQGEERRSKEPCRKLMDRSYWSKSMAMNSRKSVSDLVVAGCDGQGGAALSGVKTIVPADAGNGRL